MGHDFLDLSLLTDGLRAEREQGITIDVAYRYFATAQRRFIIADTPGHEQYTRNMVTGASTADLAIVLVDARKGVVAQSKRHAFISSMLGIPHVVVCVNKMDLVDYDEGVFDAIVEEFDRFAARLEMPDVTFIPISALLGDNVVERSEAMPWYQGPPLLYHLEHVHIASDRNLIDVRFPVQWVIRPPASSGIDYRAYAGQVAGGVIRPGDEVVVLPSGQHSTVAGIDTYDGPVQEAFPAMSVAIRLTDDIDVSRGSTIARTQNQPHGLQQLRVPAVLDVRGAAQPPPPVRRQAHDPHRDARRGGPALPHRRRDAAPRRSRRDAEPQRPRPRPPAPQLAAGVRLLPAQPAHREPDRHRRGDQRNGRRRRDPRHRGRGTRRHHQDRAQPQRALAGLADDPRAALDDARAHGRHGVVHGPAGRRQVDRRGGRRGAPDRARSPRLPARRRQPPPRAQRRPRLRRRGAPRERAPHLPRRQAARRVGIDRARQPREPLLGRPRRRPPRCTATPSSGSSKSSSTRRSSCARSATRRASTPAPARANWRA